jgi:uncharacterized protein (TIGR02996 family)
VLQQTAAAITVRRNIPALGAAAAADLSRSAWRPNRQRVFALSSQVRQQKKTLPGRPVVDQHTAFLQAIAETPEDDTPRLVFADWLDEQGHPDRARFIHEQCEQTRRGQQPTSEGAGAAAWSAVLPPLNAGNKDLQCSWIYRRGIPEGVSYGPLDVSARNYTQGPGGPPVQASFTGPVAQFLLDAAGVFSVPTIREVAADCKEIVDYDYDKHYRPLEERGDIAQEDLQSLANLPELAQLDRLALQHAALTPTGLQVLLASPHLTRLKSLNLNGSAVSEDVLQVLVDSPIAQHLETLQLHGGIFGYLKEPRVCIPGRGVAVLPVASSLARLETLDLGGNQLGDAEADALINAAHLPRLCHLDVTGHTISEDRLQRLRERFHDVTGVPQRWQPWPPWAAQQQLGQGQ